MRQQHDDIMMAKASSVETNADLADEVATRKESQDALKKSNTTLQASEAEARDLLAKVTETFEVLAFEKKENEMQRQFVSMASHEFRTPLAIIDGSANRLTRMLVDVSDDWLVEKIAKIRSAVSRMTEMIESTLYTDKAYSERLELSLNKRSFKALIEDICDRQRAVTPDFRIELHFGNMPNVIYGSR